MVSIIFKIYQSHWKVGSPPPKIPNQLSKHTQYFTHEHQNTAGTKYKLDKTLAYSSKNIRCSNGINLASVLVKVPNDRHYILARNKKLPYWICTGLLLQVS